MKLKFEKWIENQNFRKSSNDLFEEAITAYKGGAYRSSLLFSYISFLDILKNRILSSKPPNGITKEHWLNIQSTLRDRESWEKKTYDLIKQNKPAPIFPISEGLKREVEYWKDRRNDTAHFKNEKIDYYHTESFWSFLETNLDKFVTAGSKESLIADFKRFYDPRFTSSEEKIQPFIERISTAVEANFLQEFFGQLMTELAENPFEPEYRDIFNEILNYGTPAVKSELITFFKGDERELIDFIYDYPRRVAHLQLDRRFIRELWFTRLFDYKNDFEMYTSILNNNLIPEKDRDEANEVVIRRSYRYVPDVKFVHTLTVTGYYQRLVKHIFPKKGYSSFNEGNACSNIVLHYLVQFPLSKEIVDSLAAAINTRYPPYDLIDKLNKFIEVNDNFRTSLIAILKEENLSVPEGLELPGFYEDTEIEEEYDDLPF